MCAPPQLAIPGWDVGDARHPQRGTGTKVSTGVRPPTSASLVSPGRSCPVSSAARTMVDISGARTLCRAPRQAFPG